MSIVDTNKVTKVKDLINNEVPQNGTLLLLHINQWFTLHNLANGYKDDQIRNYKKIFDKTKNTAGEEKENRRLGRRMYKQSETSIPRIDQLKVEEDSYINSKPGKKLNPLSTQNIFGSQIVIQ